MMKNESYTRYKITDETADHNTILSHLGSTFLYYKNIIHYYTVKPPLLVITMKDMFVYISLHIITYTTLYDDSLTAYIS